MDNIDRMIVCGDASYGGVSYVCPDCGDIKFVPFRCRSRLCLSCGNKYCIERMTSMSFKLVRAPHRHMVFTIDDELRIYFKNDRRLLGLLFTAVKEVLLNMFHKLNKSKNFTPGVIMVIHTFGRDLKWNPHIHALCTEGGNSDDGEWRRINYFNYTYLRRSFQTVLLNLMEKALGPSFKKVKAHIYKKDKNGFYVHAPKVQPNQNISETIKYIGRYLGRPTISSKRILKYDEINDTVTYCYNRHEDEKYIEETIPTLEFIERVLQHCPEYEFKEIRYYGLYARHRECDSKLIHVISKEKHHVYRQLTNWRVLMQSCFGHDPVFCSRCRKEMRPSEMTLNHKNVSLDELYEKVMRKSHIKNQQHHRWTAPKQKSG